MPMGKTTNKSTSPNKPFEKAKYGPLGTKSTQQKDKNQSDYQIPISGERKSKEKEKSLRYTSTS